MGGREIARTFAPLWAGRPRQAGRFVFENNLSLVESLPILFPS